MADGDVLAGGILRDVSDVRPASGTFLELEVRLVLIGGQVELEAGVLLPVRDAGFDRDLVHVSWVGRDFMSDISSYVHIFFFQIKQTKSAESLLAGPLTVGEAVRHVRETVSALWPAVVLRGQALPQGEVPPLRLRQQHVLVEQLAGLDSVGIGLLEGPRL